MKDLIFEVLWNKGLETGSLDRKREMGKSRDKLPLMESTETCLSDFDRQCAVREGHTEEEEKEKEEEDMSG